MGKISPVSAKYIVNASIDIDGVVEKPDVIGAIFGQTEGLLGADLELRELQRSGRIGRIEVNVDTRIGKSQGSITVPSSLDKAETCIVGAALEVIQRIGPCNAKIKVNNIEDVRISKRLFVVDRAKELLKIMTDKILPDSQELADEVAYSVRVMEIQSYGKDKLPAGPAVAESDEVIVVEGRADVVNLLKYGIKNGIAMNGTFVPETIKELSRQKTIVAFVDGDRGGDLIIKELTLVAEIDFIAKAPDGKEVEELTQKEIHKALRARIAVEQAKLDANGGSSEHQRPQQPQYERKFQRPIMPQRSMMPQQTVRKARMIPAEEKAKFKSMLEDLVGTRGAYILDEKLAIMGKVPVTELTTTVRGLNSGVYAVVLDGQIESQLVEVAEASRVKYLVAAGSRVNQAETRVNIVTAADL